MSDKGIIAAAVIIALALIFTNRYSISGGGNGTAYKVNTFTGSVVYCYMGGCREVPEN